MKGKEKRGGVTGNCQQTVEVEDMNDTGKQNGVRQSQDGEEKEEVEIGMESIKRG